MTDCDKYSLGRNDTIEALPLVTYGLLIEAFNEEIPLYQVKNFAPKTEEEQNLVDALQEENYIVSYCLYMCISFLQKYEYNEDRETQQFFIDMEIFYVFSLLLDILENPKQLLQFTIIQKIKEIAQLYRTITDDLAITFANKSTKLALPNKKNLLFFIDKFKKYNLSQQTRKSLFYVHQIHQDLTKEKILEKYTNFEELIRQEIISIADIKSASKEQDESDPEFDNNFVADDFILLSLNPPIWSNTTMTHTNLFSSLMIKKVKLDSYQHIIAKNFFFFAIMAQEYLLTDESADFLNNKIKNNFFDEIYDSTIETFFDKEQHSQLYYNLLFTYLNVNTLKQENIQSEACKIFGLEKTKIYTTEELINHFYSATYSFASFLTYNKTAALYYSPEMVANKKILVALSKIISKGLKNE